MQVFEVEYLTKSSARVTYPSLTLAKPFSQLLNSESSRRANFSLKYVFRVDGARTHKGIFFMPNDRFGAELHKEVCMCAQQPQVYII